jgi:hypothetical protein
LRLPHNSLLLKVPGEETEALKSSAVLGTEARWIKCLQNEQNTKFASPKAVVLTRNTEIKLFFFALFSRKNYTM